MSNPQPYFSVVLVVADGSIDAARDAVRSVRRQSDADWELLVDDRTESGAMESALRSVVGSDARVMAVEHGRAPDAGRVLRLNAWLEQARGEFIVLLSPDAELTEGALAHLREGLSGDSDVVYGDDEQIDADGEVRRLYRPAWSPERLRGYMYLGSPIALRSSLVREIGGFGSGHAGAQVHDLMLRVGERTARIVHVPTILARTRKTTALGWSNERESVDSWTAGRAAVQVHMDRLGTGAWVALGRRFGTYRIVRRIDESARVSIIIPTRGGQGLIWGQPRAFVVEAVASIIEKSGHSNIEIVVVYDEVTPPLVLDELRRVAGPRLVLVPFAGPFNFSAKCNVGFLASSGDVIVFVNDDVEAKSSGFLNDLVAPLSEPDVGMTGACLLYADGGLQHGGHVHAYGSLYHAFLGVRRNDADEPIELTVNRECSGLTAACVALRRETYESVGGMCEALPVNFNDVDLSRKLVAAGQRLLWMADVELYHFESRTRIPEVHAWELDLVAGRWSITGEDLYMPGLDR